MVNRIESLTKQNIYYWQFPLVLEFTNYPLQVDQIT